jgi:hypothetical protein
VDGKLLGPIEVFRALPDAEQDEMTAYTTEVCPNCGNLRSVCSNPETPWYPQQSTCYASAARDRVWRAIHDKHKQPKGMAEHFADGKVVWMSQHDLTPDDTFDGALSLSPQQADSDLR